MCGAQVEWNLYYCTAAGYLMRQSYGLVIELTIITRSLNNNAQPGINCRSAQLKLSVFKKCFFPRKSGVLKSSRCDFTSSLTLTASKHALTTNQLCRAATTCWWLVQFNAPNEKLIASTLRDLGTCYHLRWGENGWQHDNATSTSPYLSTLWILCTLEKIVTLLVSRKGSYFIIRNLLGII